MRSSLSAAKAILRERGFQITAELIPVRIGGFEVSDVDILAEKDGERYAVEVKSGRLDVGGVRQAYVNAILMKAKPLVVCRGFADQSAIALAAELGVEVIELDDIFLSDPEELRALIREEVRQAVMEALSNVMKLPELEDDERRVLKAIASSPDFISACRQLGMREEELGRLLGRMRREGKLPRWIGDFSQLSEWARLVTRLSAD